MRVGRGVAVRLGVAWDLAACLADETARYVACFESAAISNVLVNADGSFRVFIVTMNVLCYDETSITFGFSCFCSSRSNDRIIRRRARSSWRRGKGGWAPR
jgi:hypothetical protein